jgi:uncharacterized membrane protein
MRLRAFNIISAILGLVFSLYSVWHHFVLHTIGRSNAICNINADINCDRVALSSFSEIAGVPIGVFGAAYFGLLSLLLLRHRKSWPVDAKIRLSICLLSICGLPAAAALFYISFAIINAVCLICIGIYICVLALNGSMITMTWRDPDFWQPSKMVVIHGILAIMVIGSFATTWSLIESPLRTQLLNQERSRLASLRRSDLLSDKIFDLKSLLIHPPLFTIGDPKQSIHIVEYVDFECGFCRLMWNPIKSLAIDSREPIQLEVRQLPLHSSCNRLVSRQRHRLACELASAAFCASTVGKAQEFADWAFANQGRFKLDGIMSKLSAFGIADPDQCMNSEAARASIQADVESASATEVKGTPHILINGQRYVGDLNASGISRALELISAE